MPESPEERLFRLRRESYKARKKAGKTIGRAAAARVAQRARRESVKRTVPYMPNVWIERDTPVSFMQTLPEFEKIWQKGKRKPRGTALRKSVNKRVNELIRQYGGVKNIPTLEI